jgi:NAD(P) transhydrogenase subunit alpha
MTAAGTLKAAQVLVLGVGVAGLQAIATAKRLGAVVWAFDVRPETREQVESLGGKFVDIPLGDEGVGQGGYAKSLSEEAQKRQQSAIQALLPKIDVVITTALIPGKPAPKLMTPEMVACMKPGSLVIDLAAESGGNCAYAKAGEAVVKEGVTIIGASNAPSTFPQDSSHLYAHNLYHFITLLANKDQDTLASPESDELLKATYLG